MQSKTIYSHRRKLKVLPTLFVVWVGFSLFACTNNLIKNFPLADQGLLNHAKKTDHQATLSTLDRGRQLYLTKCSSCHRAYPIGKYSTSQWQEILHEMSMNAKFNLQQEKDVTLYVLSLRQLLAQAATVR
ncbi:MAG: hypothetical protein JKX85_00185 [Phycisphaeraceae bacterium]|nr:hypothetical protein [Phycisphaeraceae bacterium]